jgi:hypothetical protein
MWVTAFGPALDEKKTARSRHAVVRRENRTWALGDLVFVPSLSSLDRGPRTAAADSHRFFLIALIAGPADPF